MRECVRERERERERERARVLIVRWYFFRTYCAESHIVIQRVFSQYSFSLSIHAMDHSGGARGALGGETRETRWVDVKLKNWDWWPAISSSGCEKRFCDTDSFRFQ